MTRIFRAITGSCVRLTLGLLVLALPSLCQNAAEVTHLRDQPFQTRLASGATLRLRLHDGNFRILGDSGDKLSVRADGKSLAQAGNIRVRLVRAGDVVDLKLSHVPKNELQVTIGVPASTNLYTRMRGGDLTVEGIAGNKDLRLTGGDLTIQVPRPEDYGHVHLSVRFGDISGSQFGDPKGWLGNSVQRDGRGEYRLDAHVFAGDLILKP